MSCEVYTEIPIDEWRAGCLAAVPYDVFLASRSDGTCLTTFLLEPSEEQSTWQQPSEEQSTWQLQALEEKSLKHQATV